jgi:carbon storage regulator
MLVISRRRNEEIVIDGRIVVRMIDAVGDNKFRIGIFAAKDVAVHRSEVYDQLHGRGATDELVEQLATEQAK